MPKKTPLRERLPAPHVALAHVQLQASSLSLHHKAILQVAFWFQNGREYSSEAGFCQQNTSSGPSLWLQMRLLSTPCVIKPACLGQVM